MRLARALLVLAVLSACAPAPQATVAPSASASASPLDSPSPVPTPVPIVYGPPQYRALWVDALHDGIKSPAQVEKLVADAHRANINALIVQVRKGGDAYFNHADEPRALDIVGSRGFDPLAYVIRLAHASTPRIEVHAWLNTFYVSEDSGVFLKNGATWGNRANDGSISGYLDPGNPAVQAYTHKIFMDLARHYDVDGLHMDFVRYAGANWGYTSTSLALDRHDTGATAIPAPDDPQWQAWRRDRVTAFVRDLHNDLRAVKPGVKLSGALICFGGGPTTAAGWNFTSAYTSVFQNWRDWLLNGYIDFGVPMNYDSDWSPREARWFDQWLAFEKDSGFANRVVTGVGVFLNYPEDSLAQIRRALAPSARGNHVLGVAIYSYASTSVYGTSDFYGSADLSSSLPRQPYAGSTIGEAGLIKRAELLNDWFMTQLSQPAYYSDVQLGRVHTLPVFTMPAEPPPLPGA